MLNIALFHDLSGALKFNRGEVMLSPEHGPAMCFLLTGRAGVYLNYKRLNQVKRKELIPGELYGEKALFTGASVTETVVALEDCVGYRVRLDEVFDFIKSQPEAVFDILHTLYMKIEALEGGEGALKAPAVSPAPRAQQNDAPQNAAKAPAEEPKQGGKAEASAPAAVKESLPQPAPEEGGAAKAPPAPLAKGKGAAGSKPAALSMDTLFPAGHGTYQFEELEVPKDFLFEKSYACPQCKTQFKALTAKTSKLFAKKTDYDLRVHYKGMEPMYFDVVTCPHCYFSALLYMFSDAMTLGREKLYAKIEAFKGQIEVSDDLPPQPQSIFTKFYLALLCAPFCYTKYESICAKIWLKLSWLYGDLGDETMRVFALSQAYELYLYTYQRTVILPSQNQQLCMIIGELCYQMGDIKNARKFLFEAKTDKQGSASIKRMAEDRISDIKEAFGNPPGL